MTAKEKKSPIVSVLLPVYNAERYLAVAIDSLLEQTFQDFEIIAINDGSTDLSGEILDEYALRDYRVRVFHRPQRGLVSALNDGIDLARGEWIARMDADDIALPLRFELQLKNLLSNEADFCGGAIQLFGSSRGIKLYPASNELFGVALLFSAPVAHPTVIGKTAIFRRLRYDNNFKHAEDYDLWQRAWVLGYKFTNIKNVVLCYRVHKTQVSNKFSLKQSASADSVRVRHWKALFPEYDEVFDAGLFSGSRRHDRKDLLLRDIMSTLICHIPEASHRTFINGVLRIFIRQAGDDMGVIKAWIKLCDSSRNALLRTKLRGIFILSFLALLQIVPHSQFFEWLRDIKNAR